METSFLASAVSRSVYIAAFSIAEFLRISQQIFESVMSIPAKMWYSNL